MSSHQPGMRNAGKASSSAGKDIHGRLIKNTLPKSFGTNHD
jgi:hypothetical protein